MPLAACASVAGLDHFEIVGDAADAGSDVAEEAATIAPEASVDPPCTAAPFAGTTAAMHFTTPPAIDGTLADWPCSAFALLDTHTAQNVLGTPLDIAQIAVGWDDTGIYFACRVTDPSPEGADPVPYKNDACELYLGVPPPPPDGGADPDDYHLIVDWQNRIGNYPGNGVVPVPAGVLSGAKQTAAGFDVELFVPASVLGYVPSAGLVRLFDVQLDDDQNGVAQAGAMWPYFGFAPDASQCNHPSCNTVLWGNVTLMP